MAALNYNGNEPEAGATHPIAKQLSQESTRVREILVYYSGTNGIGGIETLLARLLSFLTRVGYAVTCIMRDSSPIANLVIGYRVISLKEGYSTLLDTKNLRKVLSNEKLLNTQAAISLDSDSSILATLTAKLLTNQKCVAISTNWVPNYYSPTMIRGWHPLANLRRWNLKKNYSAATTFVMMEKYRQDGRKALGLKWDAKILPIPISYPKSEGLTRTPEKGRIVSIGRLDPMKNYNLYMIDAVARLNEQGFAITWDVYGTGVLQEEMIARISARNISTIITLHGDIPYADMPHILSSAHIFVGMGTASIEAAALGVPGPVAIAFDKSGLTHGSLHHHSFGNCGELEETKSLRAIEEELIRILEQNPSEYTEETKCVREAASKYSEETVLKTLTNIVESTSTPLTCSVGFALACKSYHISRQVIHRITRRI